MITSNKRYAINEIFYSIQGEGVNAGKPAAFVRFAGCNLNCQEDIVGFNCDTDHSKQLELSAWQIVELIRLELPPVVRAKSWPWLILTGGEPCIQVDYDLLDFLKQQEFKLALETNGTFPIHRGIYDYITISPKPGSELAKQHTLLAINEVRVVLKADESLDAFLRFEFDPSINHVVSPVWNGDEIDKASLEWCIETVKRNPLPGINLRLSTQYHKFWRIK